MKIPLFKYTKRMSVSEFAEANVILQEGACKGEKFSYKNRPYFKDPTDALGDDIHNCQVTIVSSTQIGKSTTFLNYLYYIITYQPDNTLILLDSAKTAEKLMKIRIRPFLRSQVKLESLQKGNALDYDKSASTTNISLSAGKSIMMGSARSASDLCSFTCRYLICDEVSRFPEVVDKEGDPITLAKQRTETYTRPMTLLTSTPTTEYCTVWQHFLLGTQQRWCAVCECGYHMPVHYKDIDFTDINNPTYACPKCGTVYDEYTLQYQLKHEYAEPANPNPFKDKYGRVCKSYHIPGTLCPERYTWKYLREKELAARQAGPGAYQSFVNTSLGEVYYPGIDESLDINKMIQCRRYFDRDTIPKWVKFVTCGIDTQDNRFELIVLGSDLNRKHICFIERRVIIGDLRESTPWTNLLEYLNNFRCTTRDGRRLPINISCIDSGGHHTQDVYAFCLRSPRLRPVKGVGINNANGDLIYKVSDVPIKAFGNGAGKTQLTLVNTHYAKDIIREQLLNIQSNNEASNWVISSNVDANFDPIFFDQMNSEFKETYKTGNYKWVCKPGVRNEALDCTVYALTAVDIARLMTGNAAMNTTAEDIDVESIDEPSNELTLNALLNEINTTNSEVPISNKKVIKRKLKRL